MAQADEVDNKYLQVTFLVMFPWLLPLTLGHS